MNRRQEQRLAAIADALPTRDTIEAAEDALAEELVRRRIEDGTATPSDFALLWDTPQQRRWLLERAGDSRYQFTRGLPLRSDVCNAAALLVSWPIEEEPPEHLHAQIHDSAHPADDAARGELEWAHANGLLALLGPTQGAELRREYHDNLDLYDPQWRALEPDRGAPQQMVQRVEDGTADERDHFFFHMQYLGLYLNEFLVAAVGHRLARLKGETIYLTEPRLLAIEILSYFPDEEPPADFWQEIREEGDRTPTAATIEEWREYNRCRVVLGRWDGGKQGRRFLSENWPLYEAEYRYLASRGELP